MLKKVMKAHHGGAMPKNQSNANNAYCIQCFAGNEDVVQRALQNRGCKEVYFPHNIMRERVQGQWIEREYPITPGYIFFFNDGSMLGEIGRVEGVVRILSYADGNRELTGADLRFAEWIRGYDGILEVSSAIRDGDAVRIIAGPLKDHMGTVVSMDKRKGRAVVEVDLFSRKQKVMMAFTWIE